MQFKIDTKEKFHVISVPASSISADMAAEIVDFLTGYLQNDVKNIILNLKELQHIDVQTGEKFVKLQQKFYDAHASFVFCQLAETVQKILDEAGLLELMNVTPTENEAWDIVQMEEIERELLSNDDNQ